MSRSAAIAVAVLAVGAAAWWLLRRAPAAPSQGAAGYTTGGSLLAGEQQNQSLSGPFNFSADVGYNFGAADTVDLSGSGQGSGFFSSSWQISPARAMQS